MGTLLARSFEKDVVPTSVNGFLVNTGSKLVLVDTGAGALYGPGLGNLVANLRAAGYAPEQVDHVLITHMHGDHVGGLVADGKMVFTNATVHADLHDAELWLSQANMDEAPQDNLFQGPPGGAFSPSPRSRRSQNRTFDNEDLGDHRRRRAMFRCRIGLVDSPRHVE